MEELVSRYLAEARKSISAAEEELRLGLSSGKDELIRDAAEKAWNAVVQATTALLLARGYPEEAVRTYRQKRLALEELALRDGEVEALGLPDRFMAREYPLHIRCFYDGEYTPEAIEAEVAKARAYVADVARLVGSGGPARQL